MAQGLMLTVAAPGIYVTPECEHINSGLCYLTVSTVFILLSCYESDGNCSL